MSPEPNAVIPVPKAGMEINTTADMAADTKIGMEMVVDTGM
jgi:hypothetical protein